MIVLVKMNLMGSGRGGGPRPGRRVRASDGRERSRVAGGASGARSGEQVRARRSERAGTVAGRGRAVAGRGWRVGRAWPRPAASDARVLACVRARVTMARARARVRAAVAGASGRARCGWRVGRVRASDGRERAGARLGFLSVAREIRIWRKTQ